MANIQLMDVEKSMKHLVDHDRKEVEFQVGDFILHNLCKVQSKPTSDMFGASLQ
jgi:hypothetical protein